MTYEHVRPLTSDGGPLAGQLLTRERVVTAALREVSKIGCTALPGLSSFREWIDFTVNVSVLLDRGA